MRTRRAIVALTALALAATPLTVLAAGAEAATAWSTPTSAATGTQFNAVELATSSDGTLVYLGSIEESGADKFLQVSVSADGGVSWKSPIRVPSTTAAVTNFALQASSDGTHATVLYLDGQRVMGAATSNSGSSWSTPAVISATATAGNDVDLALSSDGSIAHAVWIEGTGEVWTTSSTTGGVTWNPASNTAPLSPIGIGSFRPRVTSSADGATVAAAWIVGWSGQQVQVAYTTNGGTNWTRPSTSTVVSDAGDFVRDLELGSDSTGSNVVVSWFVDGGPPPYSMKAARSSDSGANWSTPVSLATGMQMDPQGLDMATSPQKGLTVVSWQDTNVTPQTVNAVSSPDYGRTWTSASTVNTASADVGPPRVAVAEDGATAGIVWSSNAISSSVSTSSTTNAGTAWSAPITLASTTAAQPVPVISMSSNGDWRVAAYVSASGSELMTTRSAPAPAVSVVAPSTGYVYGGDAITITGSGFNTGATVKVGGTAATSVKVASSTSITAIVPASSTAGKVNVVVTNVDGQSSTLANGWTYSALKTQAPAKDLKIATKIKPRVWTKLIKVPVRMNTGQTAPPIITPTIKGKPVGQVSKKLFKTKRKSGYLLVWSSGKKALSVLLSLSAPPIEEYGAFSYSKTYSVKKR